MPRRNRTRTTSTNGHSSGDWGSRSAGRGQQVRRNVAVEAARIMATEGQRNYMMAKRKAAERLGVNPRSALPSNREIDDELRAWQGLYGGEKHASHLQNLRQTAVTVMNRLSEYAPRLVGPVLDGTASEHTRISLHLFNDPPEDVLMHLQGLGVAYHQEQRRIRWHDGSHRFVQLLVTEVEGHSVELALFGTLDLRQAPPSPIDGRPQKRAPVFEVESLLEPAASEACA